MKMIFAAAAVCLANVASALTVTFDHNPPYPSAGGSKATSNGFIYDYSTVYLTGNHLALHDDSGILSSSISALNGASFTPNQIDVRGWSLLNKSGSGPAPVDDYRAHTAWAYAGTAPLPYLTFDGIRNGAVVATQSVGPTLWSVLNFTSSFANIDSLKLSLNIPSALRFTDYDQVGPDTVWCEEWCSEFWVDNLNVSLSAVPLPASGLLLIGGLMGLLGFRRFKAQ